MGDEVKYNPNTGANETFSAGETDDERRAREARAADKPNLGAAAAANKAKPKPTGEAIPDKDANPLAYAAYQKRKQAETIAALSKKQ